MVKNRLVRGVCCVFLAAAAIALGPYESDAQDIGRAKRVVDLEATDDLVTRGLQAFDGYRRRGASSLRGDSDDAMAELRIDLPEQGYYRVYAWWPQLPDDMQRAGARFGLNGQIQVRDQSSGAGQWQSLGQVGVFSGELLISAEAHDGPMLLDAFRLEYLGNEAAELALQTTGLPLGTAGTDYFASLEAVGGIPPYRWEAVHGLPSGLRLDADSGRISGIPAESGSFTLSLQITDAEGAQALPSVSIEILAAPTSAARNLIQTLDTANPVSNEPVAGETLLQTVQNMPEGTWLQVSENAFSDVWTPGALRPLNNAGNPTPSKIILAWSSFAWDFVGGNMWLYGGGHANYSGNDTYLWRAATRRWERSSLPSEIVQDNEGNWRAIDGVMAAPSSAHTYDNNVYLERSDRFITYGGAAYNNGGAYMLDEGDGSDRPTGPYIFNPNLADPMKVGGTTGSHVQRVAPYPDVVGGNMWQNRDLEANLPAASLPLRHVSGTAHATVEDGFDVVYLTAVSGGTAQQLYKHTIRDINDPSRDLWQRVGRYWEAFTAEGAGALGRDSEVYVRTASTRFTYWDLTTPGSNNRNKLFRPEDLSGGFVASKYWGMDYSPANDAYYLWRGTGGVWRLNAPEVLSPDGWTLVQESAGTSPAPDNGPGTGVLGKWEFARDLNAFIGLQGSSSGEVWLYKPVGWSAPGASNTPPMATISSPANGAEYDAGDDVVVTVDASDADGSVSRVDFYAGAVKLGEDTSAPWSLTWSDVAAGEYLLTVVARDDGGAAAVSPGVSISVLGNDAPTVSLIAPISDTSYVEGERISLLAEATDSDGSVSHVQFFSGTQFLGEDSSAPYGLDWDDAPVGNLSLSARAFDDEGASADSVPVAVEVVSSNLPPEVTLDAPLDGAVYQSGETVSLMASAQDSDGNIQQVDFLLDGELLASVAASPYQFTWSDAPPGVHSITALAIDNEGSEVLSSTASIEVRSADGSIEVVLQNGLDGYDGTRDTFLSFWHKTSSQGHRGYFKDQQSRYVVLVDFDIFASEGGPVPDGATIQSAELSLYKYSSYDYNYRLNRVLVDWQENQATWQQSSNGVPWSIAGAGSAGNDYSAASASSAYAAWPSSWVNFDLTASVQEMAQGVANYGWRVGGVSGNGNEKKFRASEYSSDPTLRPKLVIRYSIGGNLPPNVSLDTPTAGSTSVEGEAVSISASASDPDGSVASVQFFAGEELLGEDLVTPYEFDWNNAPVGQHELSARVLDDEGASSTSNAVLIEVLSNNVAPNVSLSQPLDGAAFSTEDSILIEADATDSDGSVVRVDFLLDGTLLASDSSAPYSFSWTNVPAGSHTLSARAVDDEGATSDSGAASITVTSPDGSVTVTLQQGLDGYSGSSDTYLSFWHKNTTQGHRSYIFDRRSRYVPLYRFAVFQSEGGPVPDGAVIESAVLSLYKYSTYNYSYRLNRLLVDWDEDEATWQVSVSGVPWSVAGAGGAGSDYESTTAASASIGWSPGWLEFDLTESLQGMSAGNANYGWRVRAVSGNSNTKRFRSSEFNSAPDFRPRLVVRYR